MRSRDSRRVPRRRRAGQQPRAACELERQALVGIVEVDVEPLGSEALNPRMRIGASIAEALVVAAAVPRSQRAGRVADLLAEVVEAGATAQVLDAPQHPHTKALRAAVPELPEAA